jgi:hypothetical protein
MYTVDVACGSSGTIRPVKFQLVFGAALALCCVGIYTFICITNHSKHGRVFCWPIV